MIIYQKIMEEDKIYLSCCKKFLEKFSEKNFTF